MNPQWKTRAIAAGILGVLALLIGAFSAGRGAPAAGPSMLIGLGFLVIAVVCVIIGVRRGVDKGEGGAS